MIFLNFAHPLTDSQLAAISQLSGAQVERVIDIKTQLDPALPFSEQARALVDGVGLTSEEWQTKSLLINPPSFSPIAALVLAELHGRMGYFPAIIRLRPVGGAAQQYEVAEIINLQAMRDDARRNR